MHPNPAFRKPTKARNIEFARGRGFGILSVNGQDGPLLSHVPFVLDDDAKFARLHLVRSNPIVRNGDEAVPAVIVVSGPDSYISPDWYDDPEQVPTWNYVAVHLRGVLRAVPQGRLREDLAILTEVFESQLSPKPQWKLDKMTDEGLDRMLRMICPYRFVIQSIEGTWKLNQNKPDALRLMAADHVEQNGIGHHVQQLAEGMRHPPED
ncbi:MAG: FMN-binding negative transcriptional regulator [Pseudoruegeria sp.]